MALVPLAATVHAVQNSKPVTLTPNYTAWGGGESGWGSATDLTVTVSNPLGNTYGVTGITFNLPSGWTFDGDTLASCGTTYLKTITEGTTPTQSIECSNNNLDAQTLDPGFTETLDLGTITPPTANAPDPAVVGTVSTSVIDEGSAPGAYTGPTFALYAVDPTVFFTVTSNCDLMETTTCTYVAGSAPYTLTVTGSPVQQGDPVTLVLNNTAYPHTGFTTSFSPTSGFTNANGVLTSIFQPSNYAGPGAFNSADNSAIVPYEGSSAATGFVDGPNSALFHTIAGPPSTVTFYLGADAFPGATTHYVTLFGISTDKTSASGSQFSGADILANSMSFAVSDAFTNPIPSTAVSVTSSALTAATPTQGVAYFDDALGGAHYLTTSITTYGAGHLIEAYFQTGNYGTIGKLSATVIGTYEPTGHGFSLSGVSGNIVTSTFAVSSPSPVVYSKLLSFDEIPAGSSFTVSTGVITDAQAGVPVEFYALTDCNGPQTGTFANTATKILVYTNSTGIASASFKADTLAGDEVDFIANVTAPTDANPAAWLGADGESPCVETVPGTATTLIITNWFNGELIVNGGDGDFEADECIGMDCTGSSIAAGTYYAVDVSQADAYGNAVTLESSSALQVTLSSTSPTTLSATTLFIYQGCSDTVCDGDFGPSLLTLPASMAVGSTVTLTATGVVAGLAVQGSLTLTVASPVVNFNVLKPTYAGSVFYSNSNTVIFGGWANVSSALPTTTDETNVVIHSVGFKVDTNSWQSMAIPPSSITVPWSQPVTLSNGLHTIKFNATDTWSSTDTYVSSTSQVLVDTGAPVITFPTTTSNQGAYTFTITSALGDLDTSSVTATWGGTSIASAAIAISGTNTLASSSTFTVIVSGLAPQTATLSVTAKTLAGNSATNTVSFTEIVPPDQTFTATGTGVPTVTTQGGFTGVATTFVNNGLASTATVVFEIFSGPSTSGALVSGPSTVTTSFTAGGSQTFFFNIPAGLAHGTYTAEVSVVEGANVPFSPPYTVTFTV